MINNTTTRYQKKRYQNKKKGGTLLVAKPLSISSYISTEPSKITYNIDLIATLNSNTIPPKKDFYTNKALSCIKINNNSKYYQERVEINEKLSYSKSGIDNNFFFKQKGGEYLGHNFPELQDIKEPQNIFTEEQYRDIKKFNEFITSTNISKFNLNDIEEILNIFKDDRIRMDPNIYSNDNDKQKMYKKIFELPDLKRMLAQKVQEFEYNFILKEIPFYKINGNYKDINNYETVADSTEAREIIKTYDNSSIPYIKEISVIRENNINDNNTILTLYKKLPEQLEIFHDTNQIKGKFKLHIKCIEYNKKIILGYQYEQLKYWRLNNDEIDKYLEKQYNYINNLNWEKKTILKDYTRNGSFDLVIAYMKDKENFKKNYIESKKTYYKDMSKDFTDEQIFLHKLSNGFSNYIIPILEKRRSPLVTQDDIDIIFTKNFYDAADDIYILITDDEWKKILENYIKDLNEIILGAPPTTCDFYGYRGSANDYINRQHTIFNDEIIQYDFASTRFSSVSFSFNSATHYYNLGEDETAKTLYKVYIKEGCKLLFVTPLSGNEIKNELELITPLYQIFGILDKEPYESYNCINNNHNLFFDSDKNKYRTKTIILYPAQVNWGIMESFNNPKNQQYMLYI